MSVVVAHVLVYSFVHLTLWVNSAGNIENDVKIRVHRRLDKLYKKYFNMKKSIFLFSFYSIFQIQKCSPAYIDNTAPRIDVDGNLMDVHDGNIFKHDGLWYWFGMGYQDCLLEKGLIPPQYCPGIYLEFGHCGFRKDHAINLYTSPDLESWTFVSNILPLDLRPEGIYFRPKVLFNKATEEWVLWVNHLPPAISPLVAYPEAGFLVATSSTPEGPFSVVTYRANIQISGGGDFAIMIDPNDEDEAAYIAYDAWGNNHAVLVERLTPDYHDSLGEDFTSGQISPVGNEAPILFERQGWYYLLYGHTCCFCQPGSGAHVWMSQHPLGPWVDTGVDINPGDPNDILGLGRREVPAQCNGVIVIEQDDGHTEYLYSGDLWSSAPDQLKSHDIQYWSPPLEFEDGLDLPVIAPMKFVNNFTINA